MDPLKDIEDVLLAAIPYSNVEYGIYHGRFAPMIWVENYTPIQLAAIVNVFELSSMAIDNDRIILEIRKIGKANT